MMARPVTPSLSWQQDRCYTVPMEAQSTTRAVRRLRTLHDRIREQTAEADALEREIASASRGTARAGVRAKLGKAVLVLRKVRGLSQSEVARRVQELTTADRATFSACRQRLREIETPSNEVPYLQLRDLAEILYAMRCEVTAFYAWLNAGAIPGAVPDCPEGWNPPAIDVLLFSARHELRGRRVERGRGVTLLARAAQVDQAWITRVEGGMRPFDLVRIEGVCAVLEVDLANDVLRPAEQEAHRTRTLPKSAPRKRPKK